MKQIIPYLFFDGDCRQAIEFYKECLDGTFKTFMTYSQRPKDSQIVVSENQLDQILHATLVFWGGSIMAADNLEGYANLTKQKKSNIHLSLSFDDFFLRWKRHLKHSQMGRVVEKLADTFWGSRFGMVQDKYGINWMFSCEIAG